MFAALTTLGALSLLNFHALLPFMGQKAPKTLVEHSMPLGDRYNNAFVNNVFKNNILLTLAYMGGKVANGQKIDWNAVTAPTNYSFEIKPGQTFAFHDDVLPQFQGRVVKTANAHFNYQEGFLSDGYLFGDGVCHIASLMYWVARDAGLDAFAPTSHSFAAIPDINKQYGVSIYSDGTQDETGKEQNLYITNNKDKPLMFAFSYNGEEVSVAVKEVE